MSNIFVSSGVVSSGGTVFPSENLIVLAGGTAIDTTVSSAGDIFVSSGGVTSLTMLTRDGTEALRGGSATSTTVEFQGLQVVSSGGVSVDTTVQQAGNQNVSASGIASGTTLDTGGIETVYAGGSTVSTFDDGGGLTVGSGGTATGTVVAAGNATVTNGGTVSGTVLEGTGGLRVSSGGVATGTIVSSGGTERVFASGSAISTTVNSGGMQTVALGGVASDTTVSSGGTEAVVSSGSVVSGTTVLLGGTIDVTDLTFVAGGTASVNSGTDVLTVNEGGQTYTLDLSGSYAGERFAMSADGTSGTDLVLMPCFAAGTRIATERGDVPVEALCAGDRARTVSGALRPIAWIGNRLVDCRRHPRAENVWPVRVLAHAFGDGLPARDLVLSPDHSLFIDGVLMPVRHLVNGTVIVQEKRERVHYFHIELERHDVLLAEGLPAESYLDTGNRHVFANGRAHMALHPEFEPLDWYDDACAPLCQRGTKLEAAKQRLLAEALRRGWRIADDADLHVLAGGERIVAASVRGKLHRFALPAGTRELRILSHSGVPAEVDPAAADRRVLGARIGAVFVDGQFVPLESAALAAGFHAIEGGGGEYWRWTDGAALLRLPAKLPRRATLELLVRDTMRHWQPPEHRIAAVA